MHFLVLRLYLLVGDRAFLIVCTFKNWKYTPKLTYLLTYYSLFNVDWIIFTIYKFVYIVLIIFAIKTN